MVVNIDKQPGSCENAKKAAFCPDFLSRGKITHRPPELMGFLMPAAARHKNKKKNPAMAWGKSWGGRGASPPSSAAWGAVAAPSGAVGYKSTVVWVLMGWAQNMGRPQQETRDQHTAGLCCCQEEEHPSFCLFFRRPLASRAPVQSAVIRSYVCGASGNPQTAPTGKFLGRQRSRALSRGADPTTASSITLGGGPRRRRRTRAAARR